MMSDESLLDFCRSLSAAVRSGLPLNDAFETLSKSAAHGRSLAGAARLTAGGTSLHEALNARGSFPPVLIALIRAGEEGGKIDEFLDLYAGCLDVRIEFRRRIGRTLIYPAFAVIITGALFLVVSLKVVPMVLEPLLNAGVAVPPPVPWLSGLVSLLQERWPLILPLTLVAWVALRAFLRSGIGRKLWALAGHWLPGLRYATEQARYYHVYITMALLFKAGVTLGAMMDILLQFSQDDPVTHRRFLRAAAMLSGGKSFSGSLDACIPPEDRCALEIAEKAGRLEETMLRLGKTHYDRHMHRLKVLSTGCTILATIALAPLCFGLILAFLRPVLAALGGVKGLSPGSGSSGPLSPAGGTPARNSGARKQAPRFKAADDAKTSLFNESHAKEIVGFMQTHAPKDRQGEKTVIPKLKPILFQNSQPADGIKPTEIGR